MIMPGMRVGVSVHGFRLICQLRMAQEAFIFVKMVLIAIKPVCIFQFRVAEPAAVLVAVMSPAPEAALVAFGGIADKTRFPRRLVQVTGWLCGQGRTDRKQRNGDGS
jgi:hypothetical protein